MSSVLEYMSEVSEAVTDKIFSRLAKEKINVFAKLNNKDVIVSGAFAATESKTHFFFNTKSLKVEDEAPATFKISIGKSIYFFNSDVREVDKKFLIRKPVHVFELKRRREERFSLPKDWDQFALVLTPERTSFNSTAKILEISSSGIKLTVVPEIPRFELDQKVKMQIKIHRRATFVVNGIIRHVKKNKNSGPTIGVEFYNESNLTKSKVGSICDDLLYYYAQELE